MKKLLFIFNPASGLGKIKNELYKIVDFYEKEGYIVTLYATQKKGDAFNVLTNLKENYDLLVCSGGDGTVNEILNGIIYAGLNIPLAYIPSGSANDLGRSIGIPTELTQALSTSVNGEIFSMDVGKFNDNYFAYVAAFGIFTDVPYKTPQEVKNLLGYQAYVLEGIKSISTLKSYNLQLEYDDGILEGDFVVGLITNSYSVAGIKNTISKDISLNDGLFEVILVRMPKTIQDLQKIISDILLNQENKENIITLKTSKLKIKSEPMEWTIDGENGGMHKEVEIDNIKQKLNIICNKI